LYAAAATKFVDYSQTQIAFSAGGPVNGTFTRTAQGWDIVLRWRFPNPGRLPVTVAIFQVQFAVDNRSDVNRSWDDPAKIATEYTGYLSFYLDRLTGPVVGAGSMRDLEWRFNVTAPEDVSKIAWAPGSGSYYMVVLGGSIVFYISDVNQRFVRGVPPAYGGV